MALPPCLRVEEILNNTTLVCLSAIEDAIIECGIFIGEESPPQIPQVPDGVSTLQMPNQLAAFLLHLNTFRIRTYLEVGALFGGTFYIIDSYLRLTQPEYRGGTALDVHNNMRDFDSYQQAHPATRFVEARSVDYAPSEVFDLIFVDGDHSYEYLCQEFVHLWPNAKLIAFHDIVSTHPLCPGTKRFWDKIKARFLCWEFADQYPGKANVMGIGMIDVSSAPALPMHSYQPSS